ncbi:MAG: hypothetical protein LBC71_04790 [Oscillospiraceae bacterium]|jgi:aspartyl-tRNA(Asn)/glutamyl-tRNA(Gln) amidotransferase subunit A|nr:hypothetical protein [Oscillospiraceae bacterium]
MSYNVILEETIMQKDIPATAGSKMLESFISPIDATVVTRLKDTDMKIVGRYAFSEFGISGLFRDYQDNELAKALENADVMLCNDFTGAIAKAAKSCGMYYIQPKYGTVSRYGLIPSVCSLDQIGVLCKDLDIGQKVLEIISGHDLKDGIMNPDEMKVCHSGDSPEFPRHCGLDPQSPTTEVIIQGIPVPLSETLQVRNDKNLQKQIKQIICCAEFMGNMSRYDGVKYGYRAKDYKDLTEMYTKSRTEAFGEDVKLAILIGAMVLSSENYDRYYDKARKLIIND